MNNVIEKLGLHNNEDTLKGLGILKSQLDIAIARVTMNSQIVKSFLDRGRGDAYKVVGHQLVCVPTGEVILDLKDESFTDLCKASTDEEFADYGYDQKRKQLIKEYPILKDYVSERLLIARNRNADIEPIILYVNGNCSYSYVNKLSYFKELIDSNNRLAELA